MAATHALKEVKWTKMLLEELKHNQEKNLSIVVVKMLCILQRIQPFIQEQNT